MNQTQEQKTREALDEFKKENPFPENERKEGEVTKRIEKQTSKIPSTIFLGAAVISMGVAIALKIVRRPKDALFVGQWAAPFLLLGVYNKIVKTEGHDVDSDTPSKDRTKHR